MDFKGILNKTFKDQEIESESAKLNYLDLVTENLRSNNKKITRNSFWMILSFLLYALVLIKEPSIEKISILFITIESDILLLNLIPVFFAFMFFQNITLWNNNINLLSIFEKLTKDLFNFGISTDTKNIIKPFSLTHHVLNYQYENKNIKGIFKVPIGIIFVIIIFFPILFVIFTIYQIIITNPLGFIPITCIVLTGIIGFSTIIQAFSTYKED